jgi:GR25 family glycosyltransferase involved in LPS biosynthesis
MLSTIKKHKKHQPIDVPIYYINMDRNGDRREYMENQLASFNRTRIRGVNGYLIKNKLHDTVDGISFLNDYPSLSVSEIGCTLSHLTAIKTAYDRGDQVALILEDDADISLIQTLRAPFKECYRHAPRDWELLHLFYVGQPDAEAVHTHYPFQYIPETNHTYSTVGYLIHRRGMQRVVDHCFHTPERIHIAAKGVARPSHGVADVFLLDLVQTYNIRPAIIFPNNTSLDSTIHDSHTNYHLRLTRKTIEQFMSHMEM